VRRAEVFCKLDEDTMQQDLLLDFEVSFEPLLQLIKLISGWITVRIVGDHSLQLRLLFEIQLNLLHPLIQLLNLTDDASLEVIH
jgi:hypothetical protein